MKKLRKDPRYKKYKDELQGLDWYHERPQFIKDAIAKYPPFILYKYDAGGHIQNVRIYSYSESNGKCDTCQILYLQEDNPDWFLFERRVFGVPLVDLVPYKLLDESE